MKAFEHPGKQKKATPHSVGHTPQHTSNAATHTVIQNTVVQGLISEQKRNWGICLSRHDVQMLI